MTSNRPLRLALGITLANVLALAGIVLYVGHPDQQRGSAASALDRVTEFPALLQDDFEISYFGFADANTMVVGYTLGMVSLVRPDGTLVREFQPFHEPISSVAVSPDGTHIAVASATQVTIARTSDPETPQVVIPAAGNWTYGVGYGYRSHIGLAFDAGGSVLAIGSTTLQLYDSASGALLKQLDDPKQRDIQNYNTVSVGADGTSVFADDGFAAYSWDVATGATLRKVVCGDAGENLVSECFWSGDKHQWVVTDTGDGHVRVIAAETGKVVKDLAVVTTPANRAYVSALATTPDGTRLYTFDGNTDVKAWDWQSSRISKSTVRLAPRYAVNSGIGRMLISPDGHTMLLAIGVASTDDNSRLDGGKSYHLWIDRM
ncbi:hypothetical protein [Kitasatospora cinereorecta]|uniref:WD40 repeat domain-containing protein n=1 Tax=Kitasatospora cinereorecta TaxID=285560 RepID=A0ABW0VKP0_9ACTN